MTDSALPCQGFFCKRFLPVAVGLVLPLEQRERGRGPARNRTCQPPRPLPWGLSRFWRACAVVQYRAVADLRTIARHMLAAVTALAVALSGCDPDQRACGEGCISSWEVCDAAAAEAPAPRPTRTIYESGYSVEQRRMRMFWGLLVPGIALDIAALGAPSRSGFDMRYIALFLFVAACGVADEPVTSASSESGDDVTTSSSGESSSGDSMSSSGTTGASPLCIEIGGDYVYEVCGLKCPTDCVADDLHSKSECVIVVDLSDTAFFMCVNICESDGWCADGESCVLNGTASVCAPPSD